MARPTRDPTPADTARAAAADGPGAAPASGGAYGREMQAERAGWYELVGLVRRLTPQERLVPGYYADPAWAVRDLVAHVGTWLAEAEVQFLRLNAGTYEGHDLDIDALNAMFLEAMRREPWEGTWVQANAGRSQMLEAWYHLAEPSDEAAWWIRKTGGEHYAEHVDRLRAWVDELAGRRAEPPVGAVS